MTADGVDEVLGNYDDYAARRQRAVLQKQTAKAPNAYKRKKELESEKRRLDGRIRRCEEAVSAVECEIEQANAALSAPETASDYEKILYWTDTLRDLHAKQEELLAEWESLSEQRETLEAESVS